MYILGAPVGEEIQGNVKTWDLKHPNEILSIFSLDINLLISFFAVAHPPTEGTIPFYCNNNNKKLFQQMNLAIVEIENLVLSYKSSKTALGGICNLLTVPRKF